MYKTIWGIDDGHEKIRFTQYHFGKTPKFPAWYMEEDKVYSIEMVISGELYINLKTFIKCLFKYYVIS